MQNQFDIRVKTLSTQTLIHDFIFSHYIDAPFLPYMRTMITNELKVRNPEAFNAWWESEDCCAETLPNFFPAE